jgi:hypothetical protein
MIPTEKDGHLFLVFPKTRHFIDLDVVRIRKRPRFIIKDFEMN